jgi:AraC-like DNA-binding protein
VAASTYGERPPTPAASPHVLCTWTQVTTARHVQHVVPDGCVDVLVSDAGAVVAGPATRAVDVALAAGTAITALRFRPGHAAAALGVPASALVDCEVALADVLPGDLARRLIGAADRAAALETAFHAGPADPLVDVALPWLVRNPDRPVQALAALLGVSPRQLQRRVAAAVGYPPKTFQRIARLQRLLALARRAPAPLARLALDAGFADQAHMTREVHALAGRTPSQLLGVADTTLGMSDLFKSGPPVAGSLGPP